MEMTYNELVTAESNAALKVLEERKNLIQSVLKARDEGKLLPPKVTKAIKTYLLSIGEYEELSSKIKARDHDSN